MSPQKISFPVTGKHRDHIFQLHGAAIVLTELQKHQTKMNTLPGLGLAVALAEKEVADLRVQIAAHALRAVTKGGYDICVYTEVFTAFDDKGEPVVQIEVPDLYSGAGELA